MLQQRDNAMALMLVKILYLFTPLSGKLLGMLAYHAALVMPEMVLELTS
jgi:hypothetical protein